MIEEIIGYKAVCDVCGRKFLEFLLFAKEGFDYSDKKLLQKDMKLLGWTSIGGGRIMCTVCKNKKEE